MILYDRRIITRCSCGQVMASNFPIGLEPDQNVSFCCWKCGKITPGESVEWVDEPKRWNCSRPKEETT